MKMFKKTTFGNVVLGALVKANGATGQKIDEPIGNGRNKHGQDRNMQWGSGGQPKNLKADDIVETTYFSLKDEPEMRHK